MFRILVVDDDKNTRLLLQAVLEAEHYTVFPANNGEEALAVMDREHIDLVVLDIMMPYINGLELCKIIKEQIGIPVLILTAKSEDDDQISSFMSGADDYISKPVNFSILLLRIHSLLRRTSEKVENIHYGNIIIDLNSHNVKINNIPIELTRKEFEILVFLIENKNKVLSREEIKNKVWEDNNFTDLRSVDTHIKNLRMKLGENGDMVKTIRGYGYKID